MATLELLWVYNSHNKGLIECLLILNSILKVTYHYPDFDRMALQEAFKVTQILSRRV